MGPAYDGKLEEYWREIREEKSWSYDPQGAHPMGMDSKAWTAKVGSTSYRKTKSSKIFLLVFEEIPNSNLNKKWKEKGRKDRKSRNCKNVGRPSHGPPSHCTPHVAHACVPRLKDINFLRTFFPCHLFSLLIHNSNLEK